MLIIIKKHALVIVTLSCLMISSIGYAQDKSKRKNTLSERELRIAWIKKRKNEPKRIRSPYDTNIKYRDISVSDKEVEEIKKAYNSHYKDPIEDDFVSIGAVTVGCECEVEACTNEVFVSYRKNRVLFSKISGEWYVSSLHKWWEDYRVLYRKLNTAKTDAEEIEVLYHINHLYDSAPKCAD